MKEPAVDGLVREPPSEPYRGIAAFRFIDEPIFFGREREAEELRSSVLMFRGVLFYGDSGAGKSSLLHAGLIPQIMRDGFLPNRIRLQPQLGAEIVVERLSLKNAGQWPFVPSTLVPDEGVEPRVVLSIQEFERRVRVAAKKALDSKSSDNREPKPLLIFDQFEEYVTLFEMALEPTRAEARSLQGAILELLVRLMEDSSLPVKLIFSFREDYLAKIERLLLAKPDLVEQRVRLQPPQLATLSAVKADGEKDEEDALRVIICGPLATRDAEGRPVFAQKFDPTLCDRLEIALRRRNKSGFLNLTEIQIVCRELWHAQNPRELFDELGLDGILNRVSSNALSALTPQERDVAIALLSHLVTEGKTRNIVLHDELLTRVQKETDCSRPVVETVLKGLVEEAGVVRLELRRDIPFYEIVSEFLVPWILRLKEERRIDQELAAAEGLRQKEVARQKQELLAKEKARRSIWMAMLGVCALIIVFVGAMLFLTKNQNALQRKHLVMARAQSLEDDARKVISQTKTARIDPYPAMLATIDGIASCLKEKTYAPEGALIVMRAAAEGVSSGLKPSATGGEDSKIPTMGKRPEFIPVFSSPDGNVIVTIENKNTPVLWDTWTFAPKRVAAVAADISAVGFSLDSKKVAVASLGGAVFEWDIPKGVTSVSQKWNTTGADLAKVLQPPSRDQSDSSKRIQADVMQKLVKKSETGAWGNYTELTTEWLTQAMGLIIRPYSKEERMSFPKLAVGTDIVIFTDEANAVREIAKKDIEGAKKQFAKILLDFGLEGIDAGTVLAQMYVSSAQQKSLQPAYRDAAADYECAQKLNPSLNLSKTAEALRKLQEGNELAPTDPQKAEQSYRSAQTLDRSLIDSLAPDLLVQSDQLAKESKEIPEMSRLLHLANESAKAGEVARAKDLYERAIKIAPMTLKRLNPDEEIIKLAPKGPAGDDSRPNQASATPTPST